MDWPSKRRFDSDTPPLFVNNQSIARNQQAVRITENALLYNMAQ